MTFTLHRDRTYGLFQPSSGCLDLTWIALNNLSTKFVACSLSLLAAGVKMLTAAQDEKADDVLDD